MRTSERVELERDRIGGPAMGSLLLHAGVVGAIVLYIFLVGRFHGGIWGNNESAPGAIQAMLVSAAPTIPLPSEQKPTDNVLATQTPSPAPAPPAPQKTVATPPPDAVYEWTFSFRTLLPRSDVGVILRHPDSQHNAQMTTAGASPAAETISMNGNSGEGLNA